VTSSARVQHKNITEKPTKLSASDALGARSIFGSSKEKDSPCKVREGERARERQRERERGEERRGEERRGEERREREKERKRKKQTRGSYRYRETGPLFEWLPTEGAAVAAEDEGLDRLVALPEAEEQDGEATDEIEAAPGPHQHPSSIRW
jgi:hypothetical protein